MEFSDGAVMAMEQWAKKYHDARDEEMREERKRRRTATRKWEQAVQAAVRTISAVHNEARPELLYHWLSSPKKYTFRGTIIPQPSDAELLEMGVTSKQYDKVVGDLHFGRLRNY